MKGGDPSERNPLEIKILSHLGDISHPVSLRTMKDTLEPNMQESIVCSVFDMKDDGLIFIQDIGGDHLVSLTAQGRNILSKIFAPTC